MSLFVIRFRCKIRQRDSRTLIALLILSAREEIMDSIFEQTNLWKKYLAIHGNSDTDARPRENLRNAFLSFREKAAWLVGEIHKDLPEYTVHDVSHLDSLWEMADIIMGDNYSLTPTEVFVLGGAFLLHDAGMSLVAYPQGFESLKNMDVWKDIVIKQYRRKYDRLPESKEVENPPDDIKQNAIGLLLRNLHALQAEKLALTDWKTEATSAPYYLIEDNQIRQSFGRLIGQIAHSHWWTTDQLETKFSRVVGAPPWCPDTWTIDPLKISCILRLADASHIDSRRAPSFLRALRRLPISSDIHWKFQEKLQKPYINDDALVYTSGHAFPLQDAESWWLCLETLKMIDKELTQVDSLLAEKRLHRFAARRVAGINSPERLASYIPTNGWHPINAAIQVSDIPSLIKSLGGEELYGKDPKVALRELIQNASDAIRARRILENHQIDWGTIRVCVGNDAQGEWLEIQDNGIGMSSEVLTQYLLDFGKSYWGSDLMIEEFPGLLSTGMQSAGKFGIGFFSIFMLGSAARVFTRRYYSGQSETIVLEFNTGVSSRPIFRPAEKEEQIRDGGTRVRVWLDKPLKESLLENSYNKREKTLSSIVKEICPNIDANIELQSNDENPIRIITANEWLQLDGLEFFGRTSRWDDNEPPDHEKNGFEAFIRKAEGNLRLIWDDRGNIIGRACIAVNNSGNFNYVSLQGGVTVGGLFACSLTGIAGILLGNIQNTARDDAVPLANSGVISEWASEQATLVPLLYSEPDMQMKCAQIIRMLGGDTGSLPIGYYQDKWVSYFDISKERNLPDELYLMWDLYFEDYKKIEGFSPLPNIIIGDYIGYPVIVQSRNRFYRTRDWPQTSEGGYFSKEDYLTREYKNSLPGAVVDAIFKAWGVESTSITHEYLESIFDREPDTIIGYVGNSPVKSRVNVVKKPQK